MTIDVRPVPSRPRAVTLGVPYLALLWVALLASVLTIEGAGGAWWPMAVWTLIWFTVLYRGWRGGPLALRAVTLLTTVIPAVVVVGGAVFIATAQRNGLPGLMGDLPPTTYLVFVGYAGALVVGIALSRPAVREWSLALHPPKTRAESAMLGVPVAGPPTAATAGAGEPVLDAEGGTTAEPLVVDVGAGMRSQGRFRIGCFGVLLVFFPGIPLVIGLVRFVSDGDAEMLLPFGIFFGVFAIALAISYVRFRRRLGSGGTLRIDERGLTWTVGAERAELAWESLAGVGISYHLASTRSGRKMHLPQLDVFEATPSPAGRFPTLDALRRTEHLPAVAVATTTVHPTVLPPQRFRLMLPATDPLHRSVETAVQGYRPDLWLGWFERSPSDTPWFMR